MTNCTAFLVDHAFLLEKRSFFVFDCYSTVCTRLQRGLKNKRVYDFYWKFCEKSFARGHFRKFLRFLLKKLKKLKKGVFWLFFQVRLVLRRRGLEFKESLVVYWSWLNLEHFEPWIMPLPSTLRVWQIFFQISSLCAVERFQEFALGYSKRPVTVAVQYWRW